jgi:hypothetical protein
MYTQDFYITKPIGNNAFSFHDRKNKRLFVPKCKKIKHFDEIELLQDNKYNISFEEYGFDGIMQTCF